MSYTIKVNGTARTVEAEADIDLEFAQRDRILRVECILIDVRNCVEVEQLSAAG